MADNIPRPGTIPGTVLRIKNPENQYIFYWVLDPENRPRGHSESKSSDKPKDSSNATIGIQ